MICHLTDETRLLVLVSKFSARSWLCAGFYPVHSEEDERPIGRLLVDAGPVERLLPTMLSSALWQRTDAQRSWSSREMEANGTIDLKGDSSCGNHLAEQLHFVDLRDVRQPEVKRKPEIRSILLRC